MDVSSISAAVSSAKAAFEIAKLAIATRDDVKLTEAKQILNDRIVDIQSAALQLQEKMSAMRDEVEMLKDEKRQLSARIAELEQRSAERAQYELEAIQPGVFVLAHRERGQGSVPMHYLCQSCMDNSAKKVVLQEKAKGMVGAISLCCHECEATFFTGRYSERQRPSPLQYR
ncbi:hypothetical protein ACFSHT_15765 [Paraburkholderia silviterrae]|uniref:Uncharacterized protein n=1 Tax=Paraburkholderia silviterrae TaxID=2528715 RepID=A0A4R5MAA9_9BURK|nr:hypothetical protein [Paraburkholderia silviterrae]TDG23250.1 hypothetical protein EYW47_15070 [Paraburkholderia silviterrae]